MRVLVIGGGIAGLTLAAHLRIRGITPVVIERAPEYGDVGFSIGLYPFSANTLREIGAYDEYIRQSKPMRNYFMHDQRGDVLQELSMPDVLSTIPGEMRMLHRAALVEILLAAAGVDVRMGTTVANIATGDDRVRVAFSDGDDGEFDLVVGAEGMHSPTRASLVPDQDTTKDWGFTALTWWIPDDDAIGSDVHEYWGAAAFFGVYPIPGKVMAIAAAPTPPDIDELSQDQLREIAIEAANQFSDLAQGAAARIGDQDVFAWRMIDQLSPTWSQGRVAVVGDAASGFLPTAGVGASNAMKSAAVLADELGRADAATIPLALKLWEARARQKVETNLNASRTIGKFTFIKGKSAAHVRDLLIRHYPAERAVKQILDCNTQPF